MFNPNFCLRVFNPLKKSHEDESNKSDSIEYLRCCSENKVGDETLTFSSGCATRFRHL